MKPIKYVLAALAVSMLIATPAIAVPLSDKGRFGGYVPAYTGTNQTFSLYSPTVPPP
ncbi:MAG: hypothetical protein AB1609_23310 [Bacillota bacterium]